MSNLHRSLANAQLCPRVPLSSCSVVLVFRCPRVPLSSCSVVLVFRCPRVPLSSCSVVLVFRCPRVPLSSCSVVLVFRCSRVPLSSCSVVCFTLSCTSTKSLEKRQSMMPLFEFPEHAPETFLACSQRVGII